MFLLFIFMYYLFGFCFYPCNLISCVPSLPLDSSPTDLPSPHTGHICCHLSTFVLVGLRVGTALPPDSCTAASLSHKASPSPRPFLTPNLMLPSTASLLSTLLHTWASCTASIPVWSLLLIVCLLH